jgi:hypothetical protein
MNINVNIFISKFTGLFILFINSVHCVCSTTQLSRW